MSKPITEAFIAFVKAQPPSKPINNHNGWDDCAVGEFAASLKDPINNNTVVREHQTLRALYQENGSQYDHETFGAERTDSPTMMDMLCHLLCPCTYGELVTLIENEDFQP